MEAIAAAAPMKTYHAGEILYSPTQPSEVLFILKKGRVRVFRVSADGRALTTAIVSPGTIFGEMVLLGQHMYDNYAEALDDTVVCVMSRTDVHRLLLADARIAARITAILGRRLADLEQRLSDSVFKTVAQGIRHHADHPDQRPAPGRPPAAGRAPPADRPHPRRARRPRRHLPRNLHQGLARLRRPRPAPPGPRAYHRPRPRTAQGRRGLTSPIRKAPACCPPEPPRLASPSVPTHRSPPCAPAPSSRLPSLPPSSL